MAYKYAVANIPDTDLDEQVLCFRVYCYYQSGVCLSIAEACLCHCGGLVVTEKEIIHG